MKTETSALANWTPEQISAGKRWVENWQKAGKDLDRIRRQELQQIDVFAEISKLCASYDYTVEPRAPKPYSGLVEQQRWFMKMATKCMK
jgi:hypothetical protein